MQWDTSTNQQKYVELTHLLHIEQKQSAQKASHWYISSISILLIVMIVFLTWKKYWRHLQGAVCTRMRVWHPLPATKVKMTPQLCRREHLPLSDLRGNWLQDKRGDASTHHTQMQHHYNLTQHASNFWDPARSRNQPEGIVADTRRRQWNILIGINVQLPSAKWGAAKLGSIVMFKWYFMQLREQCVQYF
jgi:hypothetical protein